MGVGGEDLAEGGEGLVAESGYGFERDIERGNDVGNNTLKGGDEVQLGGVEGVDAGFEPLPHGLYR